MRLLRRRSRTAVFAVLLATRAAASSVPDPLFVDDPGVFASHVDDGQFSKLLDVHLAQYTVAPDWTAEWAASRYSRSGMLASYGSISSRALLNRLDLALNLEATERLRIRYDQRRRADRRFDLHEERFDVLWWATPKVALLASGWPTPQKQYSAFGLGGAWGRADGGNQLVVMVRDDRYVFNQKTTSDVRFTRQPRRLVVDGSAGGETWKVYGSVNVGPSYAAEDRPEGEVARATSGRLQYGEGGVLWHRGQVRTSLSGRFVFQDRTQEEGGVSTLSLGRDWGRVDGTLEYAPGDWAGAVRGGYAHQRDRFYLADDVDGTYRARNTLLGVEGIYRGWQAAELRLGYIGNVYEMKRDGAALGPEPPSLGRRSEASYVDKAHLKGRYRFHPSLAMEVLLSKEISRGSFGGFSVQAFGRL